MAHIISALVLFPRYNTSFFPPLAVAIHIVVITAVLSVLCALISAWRSWVFETGRSGCEYLPLGQGGRATQLVGLAVDEVAFGGEVVGDIGVDRGELL